MDYWADWHQTWLAIHIDLDQGIKLDNHHILRWANLGSPAGHLSPAVIQGDDEHVGPQTLARLHISKLVRWRSDKFTGQQQVITKCQSVLFINAVSVIKHLLGKTQENGMNNKFTTWANLQSAHIVMQLFQG